tara:strand:+ start:103 stop:855 length:753 start_codon:yes stop_codon:yes gene_type:complete
MKKNLKIISKKYKTTKKMMGFISIYEKYLSEYRNKKINLLEIGVENGESLKMFSEYFSKANLVGLDIFKKNFSIKNTELFKGDQANIGILSKIVNKYKKFDIIIDDGSHINSDIKKSFNYLFPKLKYGGIYVIEDLQTSYISNWGGDGVNLNNKKTTMNFIRSLADRMHYQDIDNPFYKTNSFDGQIGFVHIYRNISIIKKENNIYESNLCYKNSWYLGLKKNRNKFNFKKLRDLKYYLRYLLKHLFSNV